MRNQNSNAHYMCQWCYKKAGKLILDCLCLVCTNCFTTKKEWYSELGKCFCCQRKTKRYYLDLKKNPEQATAHFDNIGANLLETAKNYQFQTQSYKKYTRHLEKKIQKYEGMIENFLLKFPQFYQFFEDKSNERPVRQGNDTVRSKSVQPQFNINMKNKIIQSDYSQNQMIRQKSNQNLNPNQKNQNYMNQDSKRYGNNNMSNANYSSFQVNPLKNVKSGMNSSKASNNNSFIDPSMNQNLKQKKKGSNIESQRGGQQFGRFDSNQKAYQGNNPQKFIKNNQQQQVYNPKSQQDRNIFPVYKIGGQKKMSDPNQRSNLNNINMQTALRSIRSSEDQEGSLPFHQKDVRQPIKKYGKRNNQKIKTQSGEQSFDPQLSREFNIVPQRKFLK